MRVVEINSLVLAYLGDAIYEEYVRKYLINKGIANVDSLQKEAVKYVSAKAQKEIVENLISEEFLNEEEFDVFKRARNCKSNTHPKNCDIGDYKMATGLEALIGYLDLVGNKSRVDEIMKKVLGE